MSRERLSANGAHEFELRNLVNTLDRLGYALPEKPKKADKPSRWLVRSDVSDKLTTPSLNSLNPQHGQMGTYGVFFTCSQNSLFLSENYSAHLIFDRDVLAKTWETNNSQEWAQKMEQIAKEKRLDLTKIGDGLTAEEEIYKRHAVFQPRTGICTIPREVNLETATAVIVERRVMDKILDAHPTLKVIPMGHY